VRAASEYHLHSHPDIVYRELELLRGIYECLRQLLPVQRRPPECAAMDRSALLDLVALKGYDEQSMEYQTAKAKAKRRRP